MVAPQWQFNVSLINSLTSVQQYFHQHLFFNFLFSLEFQRTSTVFLLPLFTSIQHEILVWPALCSVVHVIRVQNVPNHNWTTIWMGLWEFTERVYTISLQILSRCRSCVCMKVYHRTLVVMKCSLSSCGTERDGDTSDYLVAVREHEDY